MGGENVIQDGRLALTIIEQTFKGQPKAPGAGKAALIWHGVGREEGGRGAKNERMVVELLVRGRKGRAGVVGGEGWSVEGKRMR